MKNNHIYFSNEELKAIYEAVDAILDCYKRDGVEDKDLEAAQDKIFNEIYNRKGDME